MADELVGSNSFRASVVCKCSQTDSIVFQECMHSSVAPFERWLRRRFFLKQASEKLHLDITYLIVDDSSTDLFLSQTNCMHSDLLHPISLILKVCPLTSLRRLSIFSLTVVAAVGNGTTGFGSVAPAAGRLL